MANTNDVHVADDQLCLALSKTGALVTRSGRPIVATAAQWRELAPKMAGQLIPTDIPIFGMVWLNGSRGGDLDPWDALIKVVQAFTAGVLVLSPEADG